MTTKDNGNSWRERFRGILGNDITIGKLRNEMETFIEKEIQQAELRSKIEVLEELQGGAFSSTVLGKIEDLKEQLK